MHLGQFYYKSFFVVWFFVYNLCFVDVVPIFITWRSLFISRIPLLKQIDEIWPSPVARKEIITRFSPFSGSTDQNLRQWKDWKWPLILWHIPWCSRNQWAFSFIRKPVIIDLHLFNYSSDLFAMFIKYAWNIPMSSGKLRSVCSRVSMTCFHPESLFGLPFFGSVDHRS
jgi:hypothetical protein